MAQKEANRSWIWKVNRWLGLRFAYLFYHLGFSANLLSSLRVILAFCGFYLLARVKYGDVWQPLVGAIILAWQINLDYADGPIARVQGKSSELGEKMDGLANAASRSVVLILAGFLTDNLVLFIASAFSAYIIVTFISITKMRIKTTGKWKSLALVFRFFLYVPVMGFVLPLLIAVHGLLEMKVDLFSYIIVFLYSGLALIWLILLLRYEDQNESVLEPLNLGKSE
jgi:phosphatidylglycerophosphate synthase